MRVPDVRAIGLVAAAAGYVAGPELTRRAGISPDVAYTGSMLATGALLSVGLAALAVHGTPMLRWQVDAFERISPVVRQLSTMAAVGGFSAAAAGALGVFTSSHGHSVVVP